MVSLETSKAPPTKAGHAGKLDRILLVRLRSGSVIGWSRQSVPGQFPRMRAGRPIYDGAVTGQSMTLVIISINSTKRTRPYANTDAADGL